MNCPKCGFEQVDGLPACAQCGVIFAKLRSPLERGSQPAEVSLPLPPADSQSVLPLGGLLFSVETGESPLFIAGRGLMLALLVFGSGRFIFASLASGYAADTPLHLIHLPFHEAGHVIFGVLGVRFLTVLGGTLGQLLIPLIIIGAFVLRRNPFGGSVGLWWLGQSFMDVAVYANDARAGQLPLLGGVTGSEVEDYHDWEVMLGKLGWLAYDHHIARLFYGCGALLMLLALAWGGFILWRQLQLRSIEKPSW